MEEPRERPFAEDPFPRHVNAGRRSVLLGGTVLDACSLHSGPVLAEQPLEVVGGREASLGTVDLDLGAVLAEADAGGEAVLLWRSNLLELRVCQTALLVEELHRRGPSVLVVLLIRPATGAVHELEIGEGAGCADTTPQQNIDNRNHAIFPSHPGTARILLIVIT